MRSSVASSAAIQSYRRLLDSYGYVLGVVLSDGSVFAVDEVVTHRCKDGSISRYPITKYRIALQCKSERFARRFSGELASVLGRSVSYRPFTRSNFRASTIVGVPPNYVFSGYQVRVRAKALALRLMADRDAVRARGVDMPRVFAEAVLTGIVDGDGHVRPQGEIVIRTVFPDAVAAIAESAGHPARIYDYASQTAPQVNISARSARRIDTVKR